MDAAGRSFRFLKRKLDYCNWFSRRSFAGSSTIGMTLNSARTSARDLEAAQAIEIGQQDPRSQATSLPHSLTMVAPLCPAPPSPALSLEVAQANEIGQQDSPLRHSARAGAIPIHNPVSPDSGGHGVVAFPQDWGGVVIGFCFTSAVEIALESLQPQIELPLLVHLLSLPMVFAFCSFFVSNFISAHHFPRFAHALIQVGKLSVLIAFFLAISVPFSLSFKIISWSLCVLSLLAIAYFVASSGRLRHA